MPINVAGLVKAGRNLTAGAFVDTATVYDRTLVADGHGGFTQTYIARANPLSVSLLQVKDSAVGEDAGVLQGSATLTLTAPYGTELPDGTRVVVLGLTYEVTARKSAKSERTIIERYQIREVR